ncbi:hypothetical protein LBMAG33_7630 [Candidatus Levyibacteriota bacterium]|nr:hypothetical protein [Candidatus Levybacteria bacterium]GDX62453.1 hypothetical protein LBMAG33_7630 [Candidatus Levybacteria bacterium]
MVKYKECYLEMVEQNKELFVSFDKLHEEYEANSEKWQALFNKEGANVLEVIRKYENILCGKSENGKYGKFSSTLSDKFWNEIRSHFSKIDFIGME